MAGAKKYADIDLYEKKLANVMKRFEVEEFNFDWSRHGGWVQFRRKGRLYQFDHSVEKAKAKGQDIRYGSDAFAQLVLALEDLARLAERGIYDIDVFIEGLLYLPPPALIPSCFEELGFSSLPTDTAEVEARYRSEAKKRHPDAPGGSEEAFIKLTRAAEECKQYLERS